MKNKLLFIVVCMIILCPVFNAQARDNGYLVMFKDGFKPETSEYNLKVVNEVRGIYSADNQEILKPLEKYIECISENSEVTLIEDDFPTVFSLRDETTSSEYEQLSLIKAEAGWKLEAYGNDVKVAVIDSGCYNHDDLKGNLLGGKNYLTGTTDVTDNNGHGTHVSGIIAAEINGIGTAGVAPKAKIVPLKCFDPSRSTYADDILDAIYDAVDVYGCKIINMSWGLPSHNSLLKAAIDYAYNKGVIMVAAVGNYGNTTLYYPAAYDNVIGVASVNRNKVKSSFSQYNRSVMVAALGESVKSTGKDGNYVLKSGTSQATPMVSGIAAVALSVDGSLTNTLFRQMLIETAEDLGDAGYDTKYGYGLANEEALLGKLMDKLGCYVSPVNLHNDEAYVLVKNNNDYILEAASLFSEYSGNKFVGCSVTPINLAPSEEKIVGIKSKNDKVSHFLWSGLGNPNPLTIRRNLDLLIK